MTKKRGVNMSIKSSHIRGRKLSDRAIQATYTIVVSIVSVIGNVNLSNSNVGVGDQRRNVITAMNNDVSLNDERCCLDG